jgi:hypothetical protein
LLARSGLADDCSNLVRICLLQARALRLHAQAQALQSELDHKRRRLDAFHSEKLELQRMHEEHKMQS